MSTDEVVVGGGWLEPPSPFQGFPATDWLTTCRSQGPSAPAKIPEVRKCLGSSFLSPCISTEKTGRDTGRREAEPPEVAQITETVVPFWPWKCRAMA